MLTVVPQIGAGSWSSPGRLLSSCRTMACWTSCRKAPLSLLASAQSKDPFAYACDRQPVAQGISQLLIELMTGCEESRRCRIPELPSLHTNLL